MKLVGAILISLLLAGCDAGVSGDNSNFKVDKFIYVSHTRICTGVGEDRVDDRFSKINWDAYDVKIHGGDMLCQTSKEPERLKRVGDIFGVLDSNFIWVKGNHDDDSLDLVKEYTQRPNPFRVVKRGVTAFVILDYFMTDDVFDSKEFATQLKQCDLHGIKHMVVLTHYLYWTYNHPELKGLDQTVSNVEVCEHAKWCLFPNDFMEEIYPILVDFKNGQLLDVICLAGDAGTRRRTFEFKDENGIDFLACGVSNESEIDSVLVFQTTSDVMLTWEFKALNDLID